MLQLSYTEAGGLSCLMKCQASPNLYPLSLYTVSITCINAKCACNFINIPTDADGLTLSCGSLSALMIELRVVGVVQLLTQQSGL